MRIFTLLPHIVHLRARQLYATLWMEQERWPYWLPVILGIGIGGYFMLPFEPPLWWGAGALGVAGGIWQATKNYFYRRLLAVMAMTLMLGFCAAQWRVALVQSPLLKRTLQVAEVQGTVDSIEDRGAQGARLLLRVQHVSKLNANETPLYVGLTWRQAVQPAALLGAEVTLLATLMPPMSPSSPADYDFRRQSFFQQIGANGIVLRPPQILTPAPIKWWDAERWREQTAQAVLTRMSGAEGAIAVALMTGERGAIDAVTNENMRRAGTAHLLSISGMHIGMMGVFAFSLIRALMALSPTLAQRYNVKAMAAAAGLCAVVVYTLLVGAPIPAVRSMLMSGLVFVAMMLRRLSLSMRTVSLAAAAILLFAPESLLSPSFQMSFAAIVALISAYEYWGERRKKWAEEEAWGQKTGLVYQAYTYVGGIIVTSLIAGLATLPYGAWNFNRLQLFGILGNLLAVPLTAALVMPAVALSYLLIPLGWADPALWVMHWGLWGVTHSAAWVAGLPSADIVVPRFHLLSLLLITFSGLWLAIWRTRLRLVAVPFVLLGFGLIALPVPPPVAIVSAEGKILIQGKDGHYYTPKTTVRSSGVLTAWSRAYNQGLPIKGWQAAGAGVQCDRLGCVAPHLALAVPALGQALEQDCQWARVILLPKLYAPKDCAALVIDRRVLRHYGSVAIDAAGGWQGTRGNAPRPWQQ